MSKDSKFSTEEKYEIALDLVSGQLSHSEVCHKWNISSLYGYKMKDRALDLLRQGIGKPTGKPDGEVVRLEKRVADLEQLAGDQALAIRTLKKMQR